MKTALIILDGMGLSTDPVGNAVTPASMPFLFKTMSRFGFARLEASGEAVGLRKGVVGNSEVGHLTIGAGHAITSTLCRTDQSYTDGRWGRHPMWKRVTKGERLHVVGLLSDAGVHAHMDTLWRCAELAVANGAQDVVIHPLLDGVDSLAGSAPALFAQLEAKLAEIPNTSFGLVMGRKWFCDRGGTSEPARFFAASLTGLDSLPRFRREALLSVEHEYDFPPHAHPGISGIRPTETILLTSHRGDRAAQAARVLKELYNVYSLIPLAEAVPEKSAFFPFERLTSGIATELARAGLKTTRIAESCKFPHVTSFFDGLNDRSDARCFSIPTASEDDLPYQPEMAVKQVAEITIAEMELADSDLLVVNIANLDQVGHLGRLDLANMAAKHVDLAVHRISKAATRLGWTAIILSDHGNADQVESADGRPFGSHTDRPVPITILPGPSVNHAWLMHSGTLANVGATVLNSLGVEPPATMDPSLISFVDANRGDVLGVPRTLRPSQAPHSVQEGG